MIKARENPFRTDRVLAARYRPVDLSWETLMRRLAALDYRAALVGPEGSGKTTLLEDLEPRLDALGFTTKRLFLNEEQRSLPAPSLRRFFEAVGENDVILLDGADLMGWFEWQRFRRQSERAAGLVVTSHRRGLLPALLECRTSPELLEGIVREILGHDPAEAGLALPPLFERHKGNLRNALRELYDVFADSDERTM